MIEVAATQNGLARRVRNFDSTKKRLRLTDVADLSKEFSVSESCIRKMAATQGLRASCSRSSIYCVAFNDEEKHLLRSTIASLVDRDEAAKLLDVSRRFFDCLVHSGLVRTFIRFTGNGADLDRFRTADIKAFETALIEKAQRQHALPSKGRLLSDVRHTSRTNPAKIVQQVISGELPLLGRLGDRLGSLIVPAKRQEQRHHDDLFRRVRTSDARDVRTLDAAAALRVDHSAVVALKTLGLVKISKRSPRLLDSRSFENFRAKYCASRYYAPILKCPPQLSGPRLEGLGVKMIRLELPQGVTRLVNRASARRLLGLTSDPDEFVAGSPQDFVAGLADYVRKVTTFRLVGQTNCLTFRTGKGTLCLYVTINWEHRTLEIGPRYRLRRTPTTVADLRRRKPVIKGAFNGELSWIEDDGSLQIKKFINRLPFQSPSQWPMIYLQITELMCKLKKHFEPPQRRRRAA
jgi:hypothetical protein